MKSFINMTGLVRIIWRFYLGIHINSLGRADEDFVLVEAKPLHTITNTLVVLFVSMRLLWHIYKSIYDNYLPNANKKRFPS